MVGGTPEQQSSGWLPHRLASPARQVTASFALTEGSGLGTRPR